MTEHNFANVASILLCETAKLNNPDEYVPLIRSLKKAVLAIDNVIEELERMHIKSMEQDEFYKVVACDELLDDTDIGDAEAYVQKKVGDF